VHADAGGGGLGGAAALGGGLLAQQSLMQPLPSPLLAAAQVHVPRFGPAGGIEHGGAGRVPQLMTMASAPLIGAAATRRAAHGPRGRGGLAAQREAAATANAELRNAVAIALSHVDDLRLRFNCCGTSVEKALLALGPQLRGQLAGLQWSYAKLGGPLCLKLLASCVNLRFLEINLWYQDYQQSPTVLDLTALAGLRNLESVVIDKRPPFQQALPIQQAATSCPITSATLRLLAVAWPDLRKLSLGLARSDFEAGALEQLGTFTALQELTLHSYESSWSDTSCVLQLDAACLPAGLTRVDLMHVEMRLDGRGRAGSTATAVFGPATGLGALAAAASLGGAASAAAHPSAALPRPHPPRAPAHPAPSGKASLSARALSCSGAACCDVTIPVMRTQSDAGGLIGAGLVGNTPISRCHSGVSASGNSQKFNPYAQIWAASRAGGGESAGGAHQIASWGSGTAGATAITAAAAASTNSDGASTSTTGAAASTSSASTTSSAPSVQTVQTCPNKRAVAASPFAAAAAAASQAAGCMSSAGGAHGLAASAALPLCPRTPSQVRAPPPAAPATEQPSGSFLASLLPNMSCPMSLLGKQFSFSRQRPAGAAAITSGCPPTLEEQQLVVEAVMPMDAPAGRRVGLPKLQELVLRHCSIEGMGLDEIVTNPEVGA